MALRIFLTGATGYVGGAVLEALLKAGHQVSAVARDPEKVARLEARGVTGILAEIGTPGRYREAIAEADVVIHTAYESSPRSADVDRRFLDVATPVMAGGNRNQALIYTSGVWVLGETTAPADESAPVRPADLVAWRPDHERLVLDAATDRLRTVVVRPGVVYGGARGIVSELLKNALNGLVRVIGPGTNHWACIYDRDLGDLYMRLAQTENARGIFHANDEGDERVDEIVEAIAGHLTQRPDVRFVPMDEARAKMGAYADALALDQVVRSPRARALGWTPSLKSVGGNVARLFEEFRSARP
jgi:nucleoside-diphosphate-sugar epimerase